MKLRIAAILTLLGTLTGIWHARAAGPTHIWVKWSTGAPKSGDGSLTNPYVVGTATDFDLTLDDPALAPSSTIQLLPGEFQTRGRKSTATGPRGWTLKTGQKLIGSGMDRTRLKVVELHGDTADISLHAVSALSGAVGCMVSDLTINCNFDGVLKPANWTYKNIGAVILRGEKHTIQRVCAENSGSNNPRPGWIECFVLTIFANGAPSAASGGNVIRNCIIDEYSPNANRGMTALHFCSGYHPSPMAGVIENNFVNPGPYTPIPNRYMNCIGLAGTSNVVVRSNFTHGGSSAVYADSYIFANVTIADNTFVNVHNGVFFNFDADIHSVDGVTIANNRITLDSEATAPPPGGIKVYKLSNANDGLVRNILIVGNTIKYSEQSPLGSGDWFPYALNITGVQGLHIFKNFLQHTDEHFSSPFVPTSPTYAYPNVRNDANNYVLSGGTSPITFNP